MKSFDLTSKTIDDIIAQNKSGYADFVVMYLESIKTAYLKSIMNKLGVKIGAISIPLDSSTNMSVDWQWKNREGTVSAINAQECYRMIVSTILTLQEYESETYK